MRNKNKQVGGTHKIICMNTYRLSQKKFNMCMNIWKTLKLTSETI